MPLLRIDVLAKHILGKHLVDTLSRCPLTDGRDEHNDQKLQTYVERVLEYIYTCLIKKTWQNLFTHTAG